MSLIYDDRNRPVDSDTTKQRADLGHMMIDSKGKLINKETNSFHYQIEYEKIMSQTVLATKGKTLQQ